MSMILDDALMGQLVDRLLELQHEENYDLKILVDCKIKLDT